MLSTLIECLQRIDTARFFETERGYQGELLAELRLRLPELIIPRDTIVEQEYQKRFARHGIEVRPDIIIHSPASTGCECQVDNFLVFELKLRARQSSATEDFAKLDRILEALEYQHSIFINIDSEDTHIGGYSGKFAERLHCFAVRLHAHGVAIRHGYFLDGEAVEEVVSEA